MISFEALVCIFVVIIGLCFGSFYNVVILRGLSGESIAFPGSKCPKCSTPLKWWHNIPVMSYLLLGGKCAFCQTKISPQYPLVELATMGLFTAAYWKWGLDIKTLFTCAFFSMFLITSVTDILERVILTRHTYVLAGFGVAYAVTSYFLPEYSLYPEQNPILMALAGLIAGVVVMEILARIGYLLAGSRAFGEGDTYVAGALGLVFGWKYVLWVLLAGFVIQFVLSLPLFLYNLFKAGQGKSALELVLFLVLSGVMYFFGSNLEQTVYISGLLLLSLIALHLVRGILRNLKTPSGCTYLPYVPAMVIAAFVGVFYLF